MYNSEEHRRSTEQIQQVRPKVPLFQRRMQLKQEIRSLEQQLQNPLLNQQQVQERLTQVKSKLSEISNRLKGLINKTVLNIKALELSGTPKFISFGQFAQMLSQNQIERYVIDPLLQSFSQPPNKVLTIFGKNGINFLVKVRYDPQTGQIYPPV